MIKIYTKKMQQELKEEIKWLKEIKGKLISDNADIARRNDDLKDELEDLNKRHNRLRDIFLFEKNRREAAESRIQEAEETAKNQEFKSLDALANEARAKEELEEVKKHNSSLCKELRFVSRELKTSERENKILKAENEVLEKEVNFLKECAFGNDKETFKEALKEGDKAND